MAKGDMMSQCSPKCIVMGLIAAAFGAGGLWMIVAAVMKQMAGTMPWSNIFLWYFGGFVLWKIAKCCKMGMCPMCRVM